MKTIMKKLTSAPFGMLITCVCLLFASGCARYAQNVNTFYEPATTVRNGSGEIYIAIPESQKTQSSNIKWVLGKVKNDDNKDIDEVFSQRSPAEIIQESFGLEFKRAGYTVMPVTKIPGDGQRVINLTKTEIELEQVSDIADLKVKCRVLVGMDVFINGQLIKRLQYEATSTKTDIKDRDMLARKVLEDAIKSVMLTAMPELNSLFKR